MRVPAMETAEVRKLFNGPEAFTPDGEFILGESDVRGFWVAAGFCAHGLAGAGGMGWQMAEWVVNGEPGLDLWHMDIRRFGRQYRSQRYSLARANEVYSTYYDIKYPNHEKQSGRPLRLSPAYARLTELGASFGEKSSWERVELVRLERGRRRRVAAPARAGRASTGRRRSTPRRWPPARRPGCSTRARSPRSTCRARARPRCCSGCARTDVDRTPGAIAYTQMLNSRGGIESDFTVTRLGERTFRIVTGTAFGNHDMAWIRKHLPRRRQRRSSTTSPPAWPASACGARGPATSSSR